MFENKKLDELRIAANQNTKEKEYWLTRLSGELTRSIFPYDMKNRSDKRQTSIAASTFELTGELSSRLMKLCKGSDHTLHILLVSVLALLLHKYTGSRDIMVGTPIYKQNINTQFVNTILVLRNQFNENMTFKELLLQVHETVIEATKNYNYPLEILIEQLGLPSSGEGFPLFDIALLLRSIHDKSYIKHVDVNVIFSFWKVDGANGPGESKIQGIIEYNSLRYRQATAERMIRHFICLARQALMDINQQLAFLDLVTEEEKRRLLEDFNNTFWEYPSDKTIIQLFDWQVKQNPHQTAISANLDLTDIYEELDSKGINSHLLKKLEKCCFKKNRYVFQYRHNRCLRALALFDAEEAGKLVLLKTHRWNYVAVNQWVLGLLDLQTGEVNLKSIFEAIKEKKLEFRVYPVVKPGEDVYFSVGKPVNIRVNRAFSSMVLLIKALYQSHLIQLAGYHWSAGNGAIQGLETPLSLLEENDENHGVVIKETGDSTGEPSPGQPTGFKSPVLLLGDRTGQASTGLLYIASFLRRNGIEAYCRWNDLNRSRALLEKDIRQLLAALGPKVVGVSMKWFPHIARALEICKLVKQEDPSILVVVGGNTAAYYKKKIIAYEWIDMVISGDGEVPFLKICQGEAEENIPNCVYKKEGKIFANAITYVHDETNSPGIYLSHLDQVFVSARDSYLAPYFYINTGKGCSMQCFYCAGSREVQKQVFNRPRPFMRGAAEVRKDILETKRFAATFLFDFDLPAYHSLDYYKAIWDGIDLSDYFCKFYFWMLPNAEFLNYVVKVFKYVYINIDLCSLSQVHRMKLTRLGVVKPQPTDEELFAFFDRCEQYNNVEVIINQITGLPYFSLEDIRISNETLSRLLGRYSILRAMDWGRLHAQPGAPIINTCKKYDMHCYAKTYEDFFHYSQLNLEEDPYPVLLTFHYPYIYFNDENLNSRISKFYVDTTKKIEAYVERKQRDLTVNQNITYSQLQEKSIHLAGVLKKRGLLPGQVVGIMGDRSLELIIGIMAVLRAGAAYLPIDPKYPKERAEYMLKDSGTRILLAASETQVKAEERLIEIIDISNLLSSSTLTSTSTCQVSPANLAYVIYTSGSTGKPRGVMVEHKNVIRLVKGANFIEFFQNDRLLLTGAIGFDISTFEIWAPLLNGISLYMVPESVFLDAEKLGPFLTANRITLLHLIPQLFNQLVSRGLELFPGLRYLLVGGDMVNPSYINQVRKQYPRLKILHMYGPTENTTFSTFFPVDRDYEANLPIGRPIGNSTVYIISQWGNLQPIGVVGELCTGGDGVARGYLNSPELTNEKFLRGVQVSAVPKAPCAMRLPPGRRRQKIYKTGDLARWLPEGNIEFSGRVDSQVKVRGFRIELGEIETRLLQHESIKEAVVVVKTDETDNNYLCAYIVGSGGDTTVFHQGEGITGLREYLSYTLPDYMIPSYFVPLEAIPLTPNGKVNRKSLPDAGVLLTVAYTAPRDEVEEKLAAIWADVLMIEKDKIGIDHNFFELGGHSLNATIMAAKLYKELDIKISLAEIIKTPTIRAIASFITAAVLVNNQKLNSDQENEELIL